MGISFLLPLLFLSPARADTSFGKPWFDLAREKKLASHDQWIKLAHYEKTWFSGWKGQPDGKYFYLDPNGKTNPEAELEATLRAFFRPDPVPLAPAEGEEWTEDQKTVLATHAQCRFPARLRFVMRELGIKPADLPAVKCAELESFRERVDPRSVSMVFSSFYLGNPSSTFGHSFLRFNSKRWERADGTRNELLDTGVNYAANPTVSNPMLYAIMGITGMFPGTFTAMPYYYKVREYNDFESRDLWSYDLDLTEDELKMLVDHTWEEGQTYYDYLYFSENCSYHMFTLLDAAAPRYDLTKRLVFYVIPSETIRILYETPGIVKNVTYRPSALAELRYRLSVMPEDEEKWLRKIVKEKNPEGLPADLPVAKRASILDAYLDQVGIGKAEELEKKGSDVQKLKQRVLIARASLGVRTEPPVVPPPTEFAPHLAHGARRLDLGYGREELARGGAENFVAMNYRFAMTDLLDPGPGFPTNMQVDFSTLRARYRLNAKKIEWDEIALLKLETLTPIHPYYSTRTIRVEIGAEKWIDAECGNDDLRCLVSRIEAGYGMTVALDAKERFNLFAFANAKVAYTPKFLGNNLRPSIGPRVGGVFYFTEKVKGKITGEVDWRAWTQRKVRAHSLEAELRIGFASRWALNFRALKETERKEGSAQILFFH